MIVLPKGEAAGLVEDAGAGEWEAPENPDELANAVRRWHETPSIDLFDISFPPVGSSSPDKVRFHSGQIPEERRDRRARGDLLTACYGKIITNMAWNQKPVSGLVILDLVVMVSCFALASVLVAPGLDIATIREIMELRFSLGNFVLFTAFKVMLKTIPAVLRCSSQW